MIIYFLCVCLCLQPSAAEASPTCNDFLGILECTDLRSCVAGIIVDTSTKFLHLRFHHLQKWNSSKTTTGEKMEWYMLRYMMNDAVQIWMKEYMLDIRYNSVLGKLTCDKKILMIMRLLWSKFCVNNNLCKKLICISN